MKSSVKIIEMLRADPDVSAREIAMQIELTVRAVEKQLAALKANGEIRRVGPARGGHWEVIK